MNRGVHSFVTSMLVANVTATVSVANTDQTGWRSHPPLVKMQTPSDRPMAEGPARFADSRKGDNANPGTKEKPWRTINHALTRLNPGDTLYLRGGVFFEHVSCAAAGTKDNPITIRSYPGELAIVDASLSEFEENPGESWEPLEDGAPGEYRSVKSYKNIRDVTGAFADSMIGLQTYWYREDLRAENERWQRDPQGKFNPLPVYCGPGLWYDKLTGHVHARLTHTHLDNPAVQNYRGETDPRNLPLIVAPFGARALYIDQAMYVRFQDLVLRGGGHNTVELNSAVDVEFENVTIYAGTYGLRARGTGPLKFVNSAIHGNIPPWGFRVENSLHGASPAQQAPFAVPEGTSYPGRNVARLNTHAVLVTEGSYEFEVFYYPHNHDREIAYSEFTDGHDGIYLSGHGVRFHHNHVHRFQDDAIYLSAPSPWHNDDIHIYQNLIRHVGMAFGMHTRGCPEGRIYIYRNICDQREGVNWHRPSDKDPRGHVFSNLPLVIHGRKFLGSESIYVYHNLFVSPNRGGSLAYGALTARNHESTSRWVMNNIMVYLPTANRQWPFRGGGLRGNPSPLSSDIILDGNIHWCPDPKVPVPENFMERIRQVEGGDFASRYPHAWETQGQAVDPEFTAFSTDPTAVNDYHLRPDSPAIGAGARLPALLEQTGTGDERIGSLPDVEAYRSAKERRPDVGPVPFGVKQLNVGRHGHVDALRFTPSQAPR